MFVLKKDGVATSRIDSLKDEWARALPPLPAGPGIVMVRVTDEQGKLNLNMLRTTTGTSHGLWREIAQRVFALRGVDPQLLDPIVDWLDNDDFPERHGAEKDHYLNLAPPYAPRNDFLLSLGELGRVEGLTPAIRAKLGEVITILPGKNATLINVNTAPVEVLAAVFPTVEAQAITQFLDSRVEVPVRGASELIRRLGANARETANMHQFVTFRSGFFAITALATVEPVSQILSVTVQRRSGAVTPVFWHPVTPLAVKG
jgi:general secretion pathway protein K